VTPRGRLGLVILVAGALAIGLARIASPYGPTLYDGVVPIDPYRWLDPPGGAPGGAKGSTASLDVRGTQSPLVAIATPEQPPQAQIFAQPGALSLPTGTRTLTLSIVPVEAQALPATGQITGNVYRIAITNQAGAAVTAPASARVSVLLRAPDATLAQATIVELAGGSWRPLGTTPAGFGGTFLAVLTEFGDFGLVGAGPTASGLHASATASQPTAPASASNSSSSSGASASPTARNPAGGGSGPPATVLIGLAIGLALVVAVVAFATRGQNGTGR
jgi:hypothetical protein